MANSDDLFEYIRVPITKVVFPPEYFHHMNNFESIYFFCMDFIHQQIQLDNFPQVFHFNFKPQVLFLITNFEAYEYVEIHQVMLPYGSGVDDFYEFVLNKIQYASYLKSRGRNQNQEKITKYKELWVLKKETEAWSDEELALIDEFSIPIQGTDLKIIL